MKTTNQSWDPDAYARNARFVSDLGAPVVELLAPQAGERILDLGCGDGALTIKLAEMGCDVVGVDSSAPQIEAARRLGLDARVADGERLSFDAEFDAVFSNAAIHWMKPVDDVIAGVWRALLPGGRFVARVRRRRMRRDDQARTDRRARASRHRRRRPQPVVFPDGRGLFRAARAPRLRRQLHRVDSAPDSAAD